MRNLLPWLGFGVLAIGVAASAACSSDDGGGGTAGKGGGIIEAGDGKAGTGGTAGKSGGGGTAGTTGDTRLGRACATDAECGDGLQCVKADSGKFGGGGPAGGYCTTECSADAGLCSAFATNAICLNYGEEGSTGQSYCIQGCSFGPDSLTAFDENKCHGRPDLSCSPLFNDTGTACNAGACPTGQICGDTNTCLDIIPACLPQCNSDTDCGAGLFCDPSDGACKTTQKTGKPLGSTCVQDLDAAVDECRGNCIGFVHQSGQDPFTYMCAENCTLGAEAACGWAGPTSGLPAPAGCVFTSTIILDNGGAGFGDRGSCGQFCDCNSDCLNPDLVCTAWTNPQAASYYQKKGYCSDPLKEDGGMDPGIPTCGTAGSGGSSGTGGSAGTAGTAGTGGAPADAGTG